MSYDVMDGITIGNAVLVGLEGGNSEPFLIGNFPEGIILVAEEGNATISLKVRTFTQIDEKFLPDSVARYNDGNIHILDLYAEILKLTGGNCYSMMDLEEGEEFSVESDNFIAFYNSLFNKVLVGLNGYTLRLWNLTNYSVDMLWFSYHNTEVLHNATTNKDLLNFVNISIRLSYNEETETLKVDLVNKEEYFADITKAT